jgi:hypothetical protein
MVSSFDESASGEGRILLNELANGLPLQIDGRDAIVQMKEGGSRHWRQMEWIGFYPEFWFEQNLASKLEASVGPRFGNVTFDIRRRHVWDLKAHSSDANRWAPLNDVEAIRDCIVTHGGLGFIVMSGPCVYESDGEFKAWHDGLKGGPSSYSRKIAQRGAVSRRRKVSFSPDRLVAFRFGALDDLDQAQSEGWLKGFQEGMRNSNGRARREKVMVDLDRIAPWAVVDEVLRSVT